MEVFAELVNILGSQHQDSIGTIGTTFTLHPTDTGSGWIRVFAANDSLTVPDTMHLHFTAGGPMMDSIIVIPGPQIAGQPIKAVVKIYDRGHNIVRLPSYAFPTAGGQGAFYHDTIGRGASQPEPYIVVGGDTIYLDKSPWANAAETFANGLDTVSFTLYNTEDGSAHYINVNLDQAGPRPCRQQAGRLSAA